MTLLRLLDGTAGPVDGGTQLTLLGSVLDMSAAADSFSDGTIGAMWTAADVGTGRTLELGPTRSLYLDTGTTAASQAGLRSTASLTNLDVEFTFEHESLSLPRGGTARIASFALFVASGTELRLDLEATRTARALHVVQRNGGTTTLSTTAAAPNAKGFALRLLRLGSRVIGQLNRVTVVDAVFAATAAQLEFIVSNDATEASRVVSRVTRYRRFPVVAVDGVPVLTLEDVLPSRVVARSPARTVRAPATVDVVAHGVSTSATLTGAFEYQSGNWAAVGRDSTKSLVVTDDAVLQAGGS